MFLSTIRTRCPKKSVQTSELLVGLADKLTNIAPKVWTLFCGATILGFEKIVKDIIENNVDKGSNS